LWDEEDGFFYDLLERPDGSRIPLRVRAMGGLIPLFAVTVIAPDVLARLHGFRARMEWFEVHRPHFGASCAHSREPGHQDRRLLSILGPDRLVRLLERMLDPAE